MADQPQTVTALGAELAGDMPAGSDHLKGEPPTDPASAPPPVTKQGKKTPGKSKFKTVDPAEYSHLKDKHGFAFDPDIHKTKSDGTPKVTGAGLLWRKPGKRPQQSKSFIHQGAPQPGEQPAAPGPGTEAAHYEASGRVMAETIFSLGVLLLGPEWAPQQVEGLDERTQLSSAWAEYFRAKNINDIPPGVAVAIAMCGYALPRLAAPQTKKRVGGFFAWLKNRKKRKPAPPPPPEKQESTRQPPPAG